jgi:site-specific recombinase XerD
MVPLCPAGIGRLPPRNPRRPGSRVSRLSELAGVRYYPGDPQRSDVDLWQREITVRGKGGKDRIVRIGHQAARSLDRYIRARARHAQAWRPQLWLGVNNREPLTANGIHQMIARRGRQAGVAVHPHRFRHHYCAVQFRQVAFRWIRMRARTVRHRSG